MAEETDGQDTGAEASDAGLDMGRTGDTRERENEASHERDMGK